LAEPELTIAIANHNTSFFLELSLHAIHTLTERPFRVLVNDDGSDSDDVRALEALVARYDDVELLERRAERGGSYAHAEALDHLIGRSQTSYTAVLDADCTPLMRGWDTYLIAQLGERVKIAGSTLGEGWSGNKPIDFPLPFMALFETATYKRLGISALPRNIAAAEDTAWEWRAKLRAAGYDGKVLRSQNTRLDASGPFAKVVCAVYYTDDGRIIGSHLGRGSNPSAKGAGRRGPLARLLRRGDAARTAAALADRDRWRAICLELIEAETRSPGSP
jgi:glycosyltransferase involved in cell wall biosynthesis